MNTEDEIFISKLNEIEKNMISKTSCYNEQKNTNLYICYYIDNDLNRRREIDLVLKLNTSNLLFKQIIIINETNEKIVCIDNTDERITVINTDKRYTFNDFFKCSNQYTHDDTINILINTDIVIGEQFDSISLTDKQAICLSRHEILDDNAYNIQIGGGSHDCWIWRGKITETFGHFHMGKQHCDGILANEFHNNEYILKNPVYDVKIYHLHISNVRNYSAYHDMIYGQRRGVKFTKNNNIFIKDDTYDDGGINGYTVKVDYL